MTTVKDICAYLLEKYPLDLCSSFDNGKTGLQFGNKNAEIKNVLITLDATNKVIDEAISNKCDMIIAHHPFMFNPLLNLDYNSPMGQKLLKVMNNHLNIFAMHTNYDCAINGMNDHLANLIGLENIHPITDISSESLMRIGDVKEMNLKDFALIVKDALGEEAVRVVGDFNKKIKKAAIIGGSGGLYVLDAKRAGCDVIITGEIKQNNAIDALENGIAIIEVSHGVEANFKRFLKEELEQQFKDVNFILAASDINPFKVLM